ncbi:PSD1 and planctomycete cytochrome C domain-containing protein [bacterium]|nr:PSD1 and planctomycete cytochrome C domain-containing protein [bacterium]
MRFVDKSKLPDPACFLNVLRQRCFIVSTALSLILSTSICSAESDNDFFESRVRPVLVEHCVQCHGTKKQEGGLRLDSRTGWKKGGDGGAAVVAGKPNESLLIQAVKYNNSNLQMPPSKKLAANEIADLETWVTRGATDPRRDPTSGTTARMDVNNALSFWSFQSLKSPSVPLNAGDEWPLNPIDSFVLAQLKSHGLTPVPDTDRRNLIRRATFDLTGLPPTPSEIESFVRDNSPDALGTLVDRLLESKAYGERWGRHWLDVARYADTAGDGSDYPIREAYKYRDWVIQAFNNDMPYDQFVSEQIAGDILARRDSIDQPERYASQVTATGFLAIGKRYGYKASPQYQYLDFADVIDSVGRSLLGLSVGCARCHDHKYDPISTEDYYALYGILQSTKWAFPGGEEQKRPAHFPSLVPPAQVTTLEKDKATELAELDAKIAAFNQRRKEFDSTWRVGGTDLDFEAQQTGKPPADPWVSSGPIEVTSEAQSPFAHVHPNGKRGVRIGSGQPTDGLRHVFKNGLRATPGRNMHFTVDFRSASSTEKGAFRFYLGRGVVQSLAIQCSATATEFAVSNGDKWETIRKLVPGTWYTLRITIDPTKKTFSGIVGTADDLTEFSDMAVGPGWDGVADCFICDGFGHVAGPACSRDLDNLGLTEQAFNTPGSKQVQPRPITSEDKDQLAELTKQINTLTKQRQERTAKPASEVAYGVSEAEPVNARIQLRGEPHRKSDEVPRRFLEVLGGDMVPPTSLGSGRLELAKWITRSSNPLTARVFVNRVWQWHFGSGLVDTASDFGSRGSLPSHPKLLDWLTSEFVNSGWSLKSLHRLIMKSRTYQLASVDNAKNLAADPENRWHWRYSRRSLDAESIRDAMLAVSGQLDRTVPKSHPFPDVNSWAFTIHNPFHAVYDTNHRSVYLMVQRNRRHPFLALFDAADPNLSVASRQPTTTPTQALFLMNSPFVHEQAGSFANRINNQPGDDLAKIQWAFEMAHGRIPEQAVIDDAVAFLSIYREKLGSDNHQEGGVAAWSALSRVLLTSNAFLFVD